MISNDKIPDENLNTSTLDEIDLNLLFEFFKRRKRIISYFVAFGAFVGLFLGFYIKRTWQGSFQIVLENEKKSSSLLNNALSGGIANFVGLSNSGDKNINTEIGILSSPSVLMEIFEYVRDEKSIKYKNNKMKRFSDWKKNQLDIELEEGTSILNINYKEKDKELIIPVLEKISNKYQSYSSKKRDRDFQISEEYYLKQIKIYKEKSKQSFLNSQKFATEQDLAVLSKKIEDDDKESNSSNISETISESIIEEAIVNTINIEAVRVEAANKIRFIESLIEKINNPKIDSENILYAATIIPEIDYEGLPQKLNEIEAKIIALKRIYKPNDITLKESENEKKMILNLLRKRVNGILKAKKQDAESLLKSSERPEGVLIKYKTLLKEAKKDELTLNKLEKEYRLMSLEKAKYKDPWELITNPTLLPNAISPSRKGLLAFGLISGFSIGSLYCGLQDKKSNLIFSKIKMREFNKGKFHNYISWKNKIASEKSLNIFAKSKFLHNIEEIALHPVGSLDDILIDLIMESLNKNQNNCTFIKKSDLSDLELENIVLLTQLGVTKKDELIDTNRLINIQSKNNIGMITLEA